MICGEAISMVVIANHSCGEDICWSWLVEIPKVANVPNSDSNSTKHDIRKLLCHQVYILDLRTLELPRKEEEVLQSDCLTS